MIDSKLEELKSQISLSRLVESYGITLKRRGKEDLAGLCPFHKETTPSFVVTPSKNLWHCFGCGLGGSVIDFVMQKEDVDTSRAIQILSNGRGHLSQKLSTSEGNKETKGKELDLTDPKQQELAKRVIAHYEKTLRNSSFAQNYLLSRGLVGEGLLEHFRIGYADASLLRLLPPRDTNEGQELYENLQKMGLITENGREFLHGYLVIAITDVNGIITQFYGRNISKSSKRPAHLYLAPHSSILNPICLISKTIVLTESPIDALSFWVSGVRNVTCNYGTNGFSKKLIPLLKEQGAEEVLIAFDNDDAGNMAAKELSSSLSEIGIKSVRVELPEGMDPNDVLVKLGKDVLQSYVVTPPLAEKQIETPREIEVQKQTLFITKGERNYRVDGFYKNLNPTNLAIKLTLVSGEKQNTDKMDLYSLKERERFIVKSGKKLEIKEDVIEDDLDSILTELQRMQDGLITEAEKPKEKKATYKLSETQKQEAIAFLKSKHLIERIKKDFKECGIVGEETNLLAGYIAATSRLLDRPLHVLFQSSSAAGKTTMMKAVLSMMPDESVHHYTTLTRQALFYMQDRDLRHTILAIEEDVGAEYARHIIKMLKTEGKASIATTLKDPQSGMMQTTDFWVYGPMSFFSTATGLYIDEEEYNRDLVCGADESRAQTSRILEMQRLLRTFEGMQLKEKREKVRSLHQNAQRLLRPLIVVNPYAKHMTFLDSRHRLRRDHEKYQGLIESITLLHQYQREIKTGNFGGEAKEYIEVTLEDIKIANEIASNVLGKSLDDCPPHTRNFLQEAMNFLLEKAKEQSLDKKKVRLNARELAEKTGLSLSQTNRHLMKLVSLEIALVHPSRVNRLYEYEILYEVSENESGKTFFSGLVDVEDLKKKVLQP